MRSTLPIIMFFLLFLSGCASMDKSECLTANWQTIGFEDGTTGKNVSNISEYRKDCAKYGVSPDLADYRAGHLQGSKLFCTLRNGFEQGNNGNSYNRNCPEALEDAFLAGFRDGQELYSLRSIMNGAINDVNRTEKRINWIEDVSAEKSELMIADGLVREERATLRREIDDLRFEQIGLHEQLPILRQNAQRSIDNYHEMEQEFSGYTRQ